ncbi:MAG: hypothetical protein HQL51_09300 [Magnetococcales bacterium]|nr:hypothetical protein [Magnetococcales bacterium]
MRACRRVVTIADPKRIVLDDLPFRAGERVEIVLLGEEEGASSRGMEEFRAMLSLTQKLPQVCALSDEEILAELAAYRDGR